MQLIFAVLVCFAVATASGAPSGTLDNGDRKNVIDVPKQCKPNEQLDPNGRCRPVWGLVDDQKNVIDVPKQCKPNEQLDPSGRCRPVWRLSDAGANDAVVRQSKVFIECLMQRVFDSSLVCRKGSANTSKVIDVPKKCPSGQQADASGRCRNVYK